MVRAVSSPTAVLMLLLVESAAGHRLAAAGAPLSATWWLLRTAYTDESSSTGVRACRWGSRFRVSASCESRVSAMCLQAWSSETRIGNNAQWAKHFIRF